VGCGQIRESTATPESAEDREQIARELAQFEAAGKKAGLSDKQ
jgi:type VI protein secretion system component VasF